MKFLLSCVFFLSLGLAPLMASSDLPPPQTHQQKAPSPEQVSMIAAGLSVLGAIMIAIPPLSIAGLVLGIAGLGLGLFIRKRTNKKLFARLAIWIGSAVLLYFLVVLGLVIFF